MVLRINRLQLSLFSREGYRFTENEAITIQEALKMQTTGSAYAAFQERDIGSIEAGKLADFVLWDRDFFTIPQEEIKDVKALATVLSGKVVYRNPQSSLSL